MYFSRRFFKKSCDDKHQNETLEGIDPLVDAEAERSGWFLGGTNAAAVTHRRGCIGMGGRAELGSGASGIRGGLRRAPM